MCSLKTLDAVKAESGIIAVTGEAGGWKDFDQRIQIFSLTGGINLRNQS
jgi:hypothetical protein